MDPAETSTPQQHGPCWIDSTGLNLLEFQCFMKRHPEQARCKISIWLVGILIPNIWKNKIDMFQTTKQYSFPPICGYHLHITPRPLLVTLELELPYICCQYILSINVKMPIILFNIPNLWSMSLTYPTLWCFLDKLVFSNQNKLI